MVIYLITNKETHLSYVGQTRRPVRVRYKQHLRFAFSENPQKRRHTKLYEAMGKYGKGAFELSTLEEVNDPLLLDEREKFWIKKLNTLHPNGYNLTEGGDDNPMDNPLFLNKHNLSMRDEGVRKRISTSLSEYRKKYGFSKEHLENLSKALKGKPSWQKGVPLTKEHREVLLQSRYKKYQCFDGFGNEFRFESGKEAVSFWLKITGKEGGNPKTRYKQALRMIRELILTGNSFDGYTWYGGTH